MRLKLDIDPDLVAMMAAEIVAGERAVTAAVREAGTSLKLAWRRRRAPSSRLSLLSLPKEEPKEEPMKRQPRVRLASALVALAVASAASAETRHVERGAWIVDHVAGPDGAADSCRMGSVADQSFMFIWADASGVTLQVGNTAWDAEARVVPIQIEITGVNVRFPADAYVDGGLLMVQGMTAEFLSAVSAGHTIAIVNQAGTELLRYSLRGSHGATEALLDCRAKLGRPPDLFGVGTAPSTTDPF